VNGAKVSVVIPAYKAAGTICRAVDSVLAQTHPAHEIIVVDDGSPDDQAEVVERTYGSRVILIRQPNSKTAAARNAGIERASGEWIAFLDADDYWEPHKLARQLAVFERHPEVGVVAGDLYLETPGQARQGTEFTTRSAKWFDRVLRLRGMSAFRVATIVWTGTVLVRREALGPERFVSGLEPAEDRDLWVRLVSRHPTYLLSEPLATAVMTEGSISRSSIERDCGSMLRVVERHRDLLGVHGSCLWRSYTHYRWAAMDPVPSSGIMRLVKSFLLWPLPYSGLIETRSLGRAKRLAVLLLQGLGIRRTGTAADSNGGTGVAEAPAKASGELAAVSAKRP
jgi:glycosyltransferase involved in cell wall biosynthesis